MPVSRRELETELSSRVFERLRSEKKVELACTVARLRWRDEDSVDVKYLDWLGWWPAERGGVTSMTEQHWADLKAKGEISAPVGERRTQGVYFTGSVCRICKCVLYRLGLSHLKVYTFFFFTGGRRVYSCKRGIMLDLHPKS
jgi:hypothetical protein